MMVNLFDEFHWRGLIYDATEGLKQVLARQKVAAYIGFDPSASSLHVGSLLPMMGLARLQRFGHTPIALVGGGTGLIGDPSGKTKERQLLTKEQTEANLRSIEKQLRPLLDFEAKTNPARMVNNADWLGSIGMIDFLRQVGKYFRVNNMLARESVKRRLEQDEGISFTEFSYLLLQAYDFLVLYDRHHCLLQMGGSDQWGNILSGIDLIRRLRGGEAYGLVFPLVTSATGVKFGKTEAGAVWLDAERTSPYRFYQFWLNTDDRDVISYLKHFTWLSQDEIGEMETSVSEIPEERKAQGALAREVTRMIHGETALAKAEQASRVLFGEEIAGLSLAEILDIFDDVPSTEMRKLEFEGTGTRLVELLDACKLAQSKGDARRLIRGGGAYLNNRRVTDEKQLVSLSDVIEGQVLVLRKGARHYHLVRLS